MTLLGLTYNTGVKNLLKIPAGGRLTSCLFKYKRGHQTQIVLVAVCVCACVCVCVCVGGGGGGWWVDLNLRPNP